MSNGQAGAPRMRRDVQSLIDEGPSGMKVLEDYAKAIASMRAIDADENVDPTDPRSWRFQAAIHGKPGLPGTITNPHKWGSCRHFSWFFLAWHRAYLYYFESVIQSHLGDDTWSLPYWDYTKVDDTTSQTLPEPFRSPRSGNELFTDRRQRRVNDETNPTPLDFLKCDARHALGLPDFALDPQHVAQSFGGGVIGDIRANNSIGGSLENGPHGQVHVLVGGDPSGWMFLFETAALDPIFWLHHCNLDRLWDVWIKGWGADKLPQDAAWLGTKFGFFDGTGAPAGMQIRNTIVSSDLGYVYESIDPPAGTHFPDQLDELAAAAVPMGEPELLGAASGVDFSSRTAVDVDLAANERVAAAAAGDEAVAPRWFLRVEDVAGRAPKAPSYDVYVNLPQGAAAADHPDLRAGSIASFGIAETSDPAAEHGGLGVTHTFEITDVVARLIEGADTSFDPSKLTVHVVPTGVEGEVSDGGDVRAGRISIYAG